MSGVTTFGIFQSLMTNAVNNDATLDEATRASMLTRVAMLARLTDMSLRSDNVESTTGQVVVDESINEIGVLIGATGNNRVVFDAVQMTVPVDISGSAGERGFLVGHGGDGVNGLVAVSDITMQYRLGATDAWKAFTRSTSLKSVTYIQFAVDIADQIADAALPQMTVLAYQV